MLISSVADGPVLIAALGSEEAVWNLNVGVTWYSLLHNLNQISFCYSSSICALTDKAVQNSRQQKSFTTSNSETLTLVLIGSSLVKLNLGVFSWQLAL